MGQHKIDILYLSKTLNITRVERMLHELGVTDHVQGIRKVMQKTVCKMTIGFHVLDYAVATSKALHGELRVDVHRDPLVISVNYRVPKGHCYNCFNQKDPDMSKGHISRQCPHTDPPPCSVCHEIHQKEHCGWQNQRLQVRHNYDAVTDRDRATQARTRSATMSQMGAAMGGSHHGGSQFDPQEQQHMRQMRLGQWNNSQRSPPGTQRSPPAHKPSRGTREAETARLKRQTGPQAKGSTNRISGRYNGQMNRREDGALRGANTGHSMALLRAHR